MKKKLWTKTIFLLFFWYSALIWLYSFYAANGLGMWTAINESYKNKINVAKSDSCIAFFLKQILLWFNLSSNCYLGQHYCFPSSQSLSTRRKLIFLHPNSLRQSPKSLYITDPRIWILHHVHSQDTVSPSSIFIFIKKVEHVCKPCKLSLVDFTLFLELKVHCIKHSTLQSKEQRR